MDAETRLALVIVIMMGLLVIMGFPKVVIGLEYLTSCPLAPYIPIYLLVSGLVGLLCPLYSVYVWVCVFDRTNTNRETNAWMLIWIIMALAIPMVQLAGGPYVIYIFAKSGNYSTRCDVFNLGIGETHNSNIHVQIENKKPTYNETSNKTTHTLMSDATYTIKTDIADSNIHTTASNFTSCTFCDPVVMHCAIVTVIIEYSCMTLPLIVMSVAVMSYRMQHSKGRGSCSCC